MKPEVIIYTMPFWLNCARAKQFLSGKGISFTEKNVLIPKNFKERLKVVNEPGGPVTVVGERILMRFSLEAFKEVFKNF
jgi:glutaredoxin 3